MVNKANQVLKVFDQTSVSMSIRLQRTPSFAITCCILSFAREWICKIKQPSTQSHWLNECVHKHSTSAHSFIRHKMLNPLIRQRLNMQNKASTSTQSHWSNKCVHKHSTRRNPLFSITCWILAFAREWICRIKQVQVRQVIDQTSVSISIWLRRTPSFAITCWILLFAREWTW